MKFVLAFLLVAAAAMGLLNRRVRSEVVGYLRFLGVPILIAAVVVIALFVFAYTGDSLRLF